MRQGNSGRVLIEAFRKGDDVLDRLYVLVRENGVNVGSFTAIGSLAKAEIGFFIGNGQYSTKLLRGPLEVLSCLGNVSSKEGAHFVHAHISLADQQGNGYGGHVMRGCTVDPTFEVVLHTYEGLKLERKVDQESKTHLLET